MQRLAGNHDAVFIGIEPVARQHHMPVKHHGHIAQALTCPGSGHGHQSDGTHPQGSGSQLGRIPDCAMHDKACPAVAFSSPGYVAAHQGPVQRGSRIDHQDPPLTLLLLQNVFDDGVVIETAHGNHLACKMGLATEVPVKRGENAKLPAVVILESIAKITGRKINVHGSFELDGRMTERFFSGPDPAYMLHTCQRHRVMAS